MTFGWLLTPVRVRGISMEPTYHDSTLNLVNRLVLPGPLPARGDVVAIRLAGPNVLYVKRIIGLPTERVSIVEGIVEINGAPLDRAVRATPAALELSGDHRRAARVLRHRRQPRHEDGRP